MRVLVLAHPDFMPPERATYKEADWASWKTEYYVVRTLKDLGHQVQIVPLLDNLAPLKSAIESFRPQAAFNLLEEFAGRVSFESHIPSFLEAMGVAYTGCNPQGLSLCRDKALSKKVLAYHGVPTPGFCVFETKQKIQLPKQMSFPVIVKSLTEEASLGISQQSVVTNPEKLRERVSFIHKNISTEALVEEYIKGREFYVGVLGHKKLTVLPPWELRFGRLQQQHPIATRNVKFNREYCERHQVERGLAKLSSLETKRVEKLSRKVYKALKISGYARLDFRLTEQGQLFFLEANPNAELAKGECLANAAKHYGLSYPELISKLLTLSQSYELAA